jgi:hypothetical protein
MEETVYLAEFNNCKYEGSYHTISIHRTEKGARDALARYLWEERKRINQMNEDDEHRDETDPDDVYRLGDFEEWRVERKALLD